MSLMKESVNVVYFAGVRVSTLVNSSVDNEEVFEELHLLGYSIKYSAKSQPTVICWFLIWCIL
jgi:hypothetical protein